MKECDIVQDLLIGYNDGTLKEGSKELVENHLKECNKCKTVFAEIKNDDIEENENIEIDYLKKINSQNTKKNRFIIFLIIFAIIMVTLNAIVFINYYNTDTGIEVFLKDDISDEQFKKIENIIKNSSYEYRFISKEDALENFKEKIGENGQNILANYEGNNNVFPESFFIKAKWGEGEELITSIENMEGIKKIVSSTNINPYQIFFGKIVKFINDKK